MPSPLLVPFLSFARRLRYPTLFTVTAALFAISLLWPFDPIPLIDEILLGLGTLLLANWKDRGAAPKRDATGGRDRVIEGEAVDEGRRRR